MKAGPPLDAPSALTAARRFTPPHRVGENRPGWAAGGKIPKIFVDGSAVVSGGPFHPGPVLTGPEG